MVFRPFLAIFDQVLGHNYLTNAPRELILFMGGPVLSIRFHRHQTWPTLWYFTWATQPKITFLPKKNTKTAIKQKKLKKPRPNFAQSFIGSIRLGKKRNGEKSSYGAVHFFSKNQKTPFLGFFGRKIKKNWFFFLGLFINLMRILKHFESQPIAFKKKSYQCFEYFFFKNGENTILPKNYLPYRNMSQKSFLISNFWLL